MVQHYLFEKDMITKAVETTESDHTAIHMGIAFKTYIEIDSLSSGATQEYCLKAPSNLYDHLKNFFLGAEGSTVELEILKSVSVSDNTGSKQNIISLNDNSLYSPQTTLRVAPTYTGGNLWQKFIAFGSTGKFATTGGTFAQSGYEEAITKSNDEKYILKFANTGADTANDIFFTMYWYEEPKGRE